MGHDPTHAGRIMKFLKPRGSGRVGIARVWVGSGQEVFKISRGGSGRGESS